MAEVTFDDRLQAVGDLAVPEECRTDLLPASQLEAARLAFEQFLEGLSAVLPSYLFTPAEISLAGVEQQPLSEAVAGRDTSSCTVLFDVKPHGFHVQLDLGRDFPNAALESLLGAPAETAGMPREALTDVDFHILRDLIDLIAQELRKAWLSTTGSPLEMVSLQLASASESSPSDDQNVVVLSAKICMRECTSVIQLVVPSLLLRLIGDRQLNPTGDAASQGTLVQALGSASVEVEAVLNGATIRLSELLGLQPGKILELPHKADSAIECQVNGRPKFRGELVSGGGSLGLQIQP